MKIYPSKHEIVQTKKIDMDFDIPLAFINTDYSGYNIDIIPWTNSYAVSSEKAVLPYTTFDSIDTALFYKGREPVSNQKKAELLIRNKEGYYYMPSSFKSFTPQNFAFSVVCKKHMTYRIDKMYNISVACDEPTTSMNFINQLMKVFGDAPSRKLCPANITINNKDISPLSLIDTTIKDADFLFLISHDGIHYTKENNGVLVTNPSMPINFNDLFKEHTNVWLSVDDAEMELISSIGESFDMTTMSFHTQANAYADHCLEIKALDESKYVLHRLFSNTSKTPVYIKEDITTGAFLIITHNSFFDKIEKNVDVIYEVLSYVYFNSYVETAKKTEWITDVMPDFIALEGNLIKKTGFVVDLNPSRIFGINEDEIFPLKVIVHDAENIIVESMSSTNIFFKKDLTNKYKEYFDPIQKSIGSISIFTERKDVLIYDEADMIYELYDSIKDKDKCFWFTEDDDYYLTIRNFINSRAGIYIKNEEKQRIPTTRVINQKEIITQKEDIYLCYKDGISNLIFKDLYTQEDGIIMATVKINQIKEPSKVFDMRQRGGGIPERDEDEIGDLLDISNVLGRPYRPGGTLIITLPKRLEPYEELILKAIKKNMIAEDLPIIFFE
jgi:hypothetical protein